MKVRFLRAKTYDNKKRPAGSVHEVDDETAQQWLDNGLVEAADEGTQDESDGPNDAWTVEQLREYARVNSIDLSGVTKKADILAALQPKE